MRSQGINIFYSNLAQSTPHTVRRLLSTSILKTVNLTKRNPIFSSQKGQNLSSDLNTGICGLGRHHLRPFRRPKVMPSRSSHPGDMWGGAGGFGPVKSTSRGRPEPSKWTKKLVSKIWPCGAACGNLVASLRGDAGDPRGDQKHRRRSRTCRRE